MIQNNVYGHTYIFRTFRVALLITLYFVVPGINIPKIRSIGLLDHIKFVVKKLKKSTYLKWTYGHSGYAFQIVPNNYRNHHAKFEIDWIILTCLNL